MRLSHKRWTVRTPDFYGKDKKPAPLTTMTDTKNPPALTVRAHRCPACQSKQRMVIVPTAWQCPKCRVRLIPADDRKTLSQEKQGG
jgi:hypothetical protein